MAKVAMMDNGLRRRQTFEEVIDYIEKDPDKVKYPNRAAKLLRNTFQLSQLDGMGQVLLEQQEAEEMKGKMKEHILQQLAVQNDTDVRTERAIQQERSEPVIHQGSSSSGVVRNVVGGVVGGVGSMARGVANFMNPFGFGPHSVESPEGSFHTLGQTPTSTPHAVRQRASPVPSELEEDIEEYESDKISEATQRSSRRTQQSDSMRSFVRDHLSEVHSQHSGVILPLMGSAHSTPAQSYGSAARSSPAAHTELYVSETQSQSSPSIIQSSPAAVQSSPSIIRSSPHAVQSSPSIIRSSPQAIQSSPSVIHSSPQAIQSSPGTVHSESASSYSAISRSRGRPLGSKNKNNRYY